MIPQLLNLVTGFALVSALLLCVVALIISVKYRKQIMHAERRRAEMELQIVITRNGQEQVQYAGAPPVVKNIEAQHNREELVEMHR